MAILNQNPTFEWELLHILGLAGEDVTQIVIDIREGSTTTITATITTRKCAGSALKAFTKRTWAVHEMPGPSEHAAINPIEQSTPEPKRICQTCGWWADDVAVAYNMRRCTYLNAKHPEAPAKPDNSEAEIMTRFDFGCTEWKAST